MLPVLTASANGEARIRDIVERLAEELNLTPQDRTEPLPSGQQTKFGNRVHWAATYLSKAGLLERTKRGYVRITPRGQQVIASKPKNIDGKFLSQFEEFRQFKKKNSPKHSTGRRAHDRTRAREPERYPRRAHAGGTQADRSLSCSRFARSHSCRPPAFFERLIVNLLLSMGYGGSADDAGRALGGSGDDGVDGVVDQDPLGLDRVYVQAKRYAEGNNIGPGAIRDFFGSLDHHKATKGLFVTTSNFSASARKTADLLSKRIVLVDGDQLTKLMIRHNVGCKDEDVLQIKKIDEDFFEMD